MTHLDQVSTFIRRSMCPSHWLMVLAPAAVLAGSLPPVGEPTELERYAVVATPLAGLPAADRFAAAATTIGADQLRDLQPLDFASALRRSPGVTITRYNHVGAFGGAEGGAVYLRGLGASRPGGEVRTTVDGVPKLNGIFNHPLLDLMPLDAAAAVQVHHRAAPLDFGNAFGAVNLETPVHREPGQAFRATLAAGSFGTVLESVAASGRRDGADWYFSQGHRRSDGARPEAEGRLNSWFFRVGQDLGAHWNLSYRVLHTDNRTRDPGSELAPVTKGETYQTRDWLHLAVLEWQLPRTTGSLRAYRNDGEGNWTRRAFSGNADSLNEWRLHGVRWRQTVRPWDGGELLLGADLDHERGTTVSVPVAPAASVSFGPDTTRLFSSYAGLNHVFTAGEVTLTPSGGVRHYKHDVHAGAWSPQAGLVVRRGATQVRAGYSRAVSYPGLEVRALSRFNPALGTSWTALAPETAEQWELALRHEFGSRAAVGVTLFRNAVSDRYVIVPPPPPPPRYANIGAYRTHGAELAGEFALMPELKLFAGLTVLDADPGGLPYVPDTTVNAGLNWRFAGAWHLSVDASHVSAMHVASAGRAVGAANPNRVGSQFALNARLARRFVLGVDGRVRLEVFVSGENLTDRQYAYAPGYPLPGANFLLGVRLGR